MKHLTLLLLALLFSQIFHHQQIGLNLVIFEAVIFGVLFYHKEIKLDGKLNKVIFGSVWISLIAIIFHHSLIAIFIHILNWIACIGILNYSKLKKIIIGLGIGLLSIFEFPKTLFTTIKDKPKSKSNVFKKINFKLYIIPTLILLIFQGLYRLSNPEFDVFVSKIWEGFTDLFSLLNWTYFPLFLLGLVICTPILFRVKHHELEEIDRKSNEQLIRIRRKINGPLNPIKLKNQYKSTLFLFFTLNLLIATLLAFEIYNGWFNFEYSGQNLSHYVHQGTYILIFSILISMGLVLFYFKGNLNFLKNNQPLIKQTNIWIGLNTILTFSVAIRCFHYIDNFGLTQKRIGLTTFLIAVIIGLITVLIKVNRLKTSAYLWRVNILTTFLLFNALTLFNWDIIIAKYNIYTHNKTNIELYYLSGLSDKTLYLFETEAFKKRYSSDNQVQLSLIQTNTNKFVQKWENQHWLSWNYADYNCYKQLNKNEIDDAK
ncbi:MAG: DUF4173 domain-containing protein [Flavobacteriales bacterium]